MSSCRRELGLITSDDHDPDWFFRSDARSRSISSSSDLSSGASTEVPAGDRSTMRLVIASSWSPFFKSHRGDPGKINVASRSTCSTNREGARDQKQGNEF